MLKPRKDQTTLDGLNMAMHNRWIGYDPASGLVLKRILNHRKSGRNPFYVIVHKDGGVPQPSIQFEAESDKDAIDEGNRRLSKWKGKIVHADNSV